MKRSTDTRIRREVVGQMLDYAANASAYWTIDRLLIALEAECAKRKTSVEDVMTELIGEADEDAFWQRVEANLRSGSFRLVFVADEIPVELQRIIEYLNEQMRQTEVIGVEVRRYTDASGKVSTIVPRVIGQTAQARQQKTGGTRIARDQLTWPDYKKRYSEEVYTLLRAIYDRVEKAVNSNAKAHSWIPVLRSGYMTFQRAGGFAVVALGPDPSGEGVSFRIKMRRDPTVAPGAVPSPYPHLTSYWSEKTREWRFIVPTLADVPDHLDAAIELTADQQPESGPMPKE